MEEIANPDRVQLSHVTDLPSIIRQDLKALEERVKNLEALVEQLVREKNEPKRSGW